MSESRLDENGLAIQAGHPQEHCALCGRVDPMTPTLWHNHWMRQVRAVEIGQVGAELLWRDMGIQRTCGACAANPPAGWRRHN